MPSSNPLKNSVTLKNDPEGRRKLSRFLFQCFESLKVYGKEPEQMKAVNSIFQFVLADYAVADVRAAFVYYLKHHSDLPTPADIATIIERGHKPPFDRAVYTSISKKFPENRNRDEWQYMMDYEKFMVTGRN